jgi:hypothetical protein
MGDRSGLGIISAAECAERCLECCQPAADHFLSWSADRSARPFNVHRGAGRLQRGEHIRHASAAVIIWSFLAERVQGPREVIRAALDVSPLGVGGPVTGDQAARVGDPHGVKERRALGVNVDDLRPPAARDRGAPPRRADDQCDRPDEDGQANEDP